MKKKKNKLSLTIRDFLCEELQKKKIDFRVYVIMRGLGEIHSEIIKEYDSTVANDFINKRLDESLAEVEAIMFLKSLEEK